MGYLTALARTDLTGDLNYSERNIVEKLVSDVYHARRSISRDMERQSASARRLADCRSMSREIDRRAWYTSETNFSTMLRSE